VSISTHILLVDLLNFQGTNFILHNKKEGFLLEPSVLKMKFKLFLVYLFSYYTGSYIASKAITSMILKIN